VATAIRPVGYDDRLSVVEHLDELRTRLIAAGIVFVLAFTVCLVFNHQLLRVINHPLKVTTEKRTQEGKGILGEIYIANKTIRELEAYDAQLFRTVEPRLTPAQRTTVEQLLAKKRLAASKLKGPEGSQPVTLGPGEPFSATFTVAFYFALLISMPLVLYQLYAFVLPAFSPTEKKVAVPLLLMVPFLFVAGAVFAYFVVVPAALKFLLNFNDTEFNTMLRARDYYSFVLLTLLSAGIVFQVPVGILGLTRLGIVTPAKLKHNRRYAYLGCAVLAAALPGVDPVSMLIEMVPLVLLYELSILLAVFFGRSSAETADRLASAEGS